MENFDTNTIDQYLSGQLSLEDRQVVEAKIAADTDFAEEVALQKLTMAGIEQFGLTEINERLVAIDEEFDTEGFFLTSADMDQVIDGTADEITSQKLTKRLAIDPDFKKEYELHQLTRAGINENAANDNFVDLFNDLDKHLEQEGFFEQVVDTKKESAKTNKPSSTAKVIRFPFRQLAIAASVALVVFAAWWTFRPKPVAPNILYTQHFQPPADFLSSDLSEVGFVKEPYYDVLATAMKAYEAGKNKSVNAEPALNNDLQAAIKGFLEYRNLAPTSDEFYPYSNLYLAIAYLKTNQSTAEAINLLRTAAQQTFPKQTTAQWYLALAYLKTNQSELAKPILQDLQNSEFGNAAKSILSKIKGS